MSKTREDYILNLTSRINSVIKAALKLRKSGYLIEAEETLDDALLTLMPDQADFIEIMNHNTVVAVLADPRLVLSYVELLLERAETKISLGEDAHAEKIQTRAIKIFMKNLSHSPGLNVMGQIIWGRISGMELRLLLSESEFREWEGLQSQIETGAINLG